MTTYGDILTQNQISGSLAQAQQAEWDADQYRQANELLHQQVAALQAEIEDKAAHIQRLERENDKLMAASTARLAQVRILAAAAREADLPAVQGTPAQHVQVFRQAYNAELEARGLPLATWDR